MTPKVKQIAELQSQNSEERPIGELIRKNPAIPRTKYIVVISINAKRTKGSFKISPAAEKAYNDQVASTIKIPKVNSVG